MKLTDIGTVKQLMGENAFKKKFGQNFLISPAVPEKIAQCGAEEGVLEIGPGIGTLTEALCRRAGKVVCVEIDADLIPILSVTLEGFDNVTVINGDIMKMNIDEIIGKYFGDAERISVCANLPYYITSPVIMKLLQEGRRFSSITVMVQKEVAQRLCAGAGSRMYGAISAAVSYYGRAKKMFDVPAGCFMPKPKVDSAVVKIEMYDKPPVDCEPDVLFEVIRGAFAQRRKTFFNSLSSVVEDLPRTAIAEIIASSGYDGNVRGEELSLKDFACIASKISDFRSRRGESS